MDEAETEFGFAREEVRFIAKHKPTFLLWQKERLDGERGIRALQQFFVGKYGFSRELLRTLVVKYPAILSKDVSDIQAVFDTLEKEGISSSESIKLIFECPKLLSIDLEAKMDRIFYLFDLYSKFTRE